MKRLNWLILTAMATEERAISAELGDLCQSAGVTVRTIGIKAERFNSDSLGKPDEILLVGLAGGLAPGLEVGEIIIEASANWPTFDLPFRGGKVHTADRIVTSIAEKERLFRETGCDAVDMEGKIVRRWADSIDVPMLHLRAISDSAEESVPADMLKWVDAVGTPLPGKIAANLALHPGEIPAMIRLGKNSKLALRNLAAAVRRIVQSAIDS